ncbi:dockerin type I domain-containing protein [uncultured Ruminococcus sp.]|jgi:hypothetical protein|uniref:dockerin type I domain-containing protein n=1 Tax=uncultured Ruminococcus sp. TaxID=165186 RepID=UPI0025EE94E8|nr:dockerin type I domain-containing protein [uncultured Ruminococcus sp.]
MKIKTLMSLAAAAALAVTPTGISASGAAGLYVFGDVNGDGTVDATDASSVLAAYASLSSGQESPLYSYQESAADINGDGMVDAVDASMILSYYAYVSVSDEGAIFTDFLEQHGIKQKNDEETSGDNDTASPAADISDIQQPLVNGGEEYILPRIDSEYADMFWIGDSRTVGLSYNVAIDYLGEVGIGIALLSRNYESITQIRNKTIIFNLGVNDLHNSRAYLNWYNSLPDEFLDNNKVIVLSVNPCSGSYARLNSGIEEFNNIVRDGLDSRITFLDSYSFLNWNSFATVDGLHYTSGTYIDIYNFVNDSINEE